MIFNLIKLKLGLILGEVLLILIILFAVFVLAKIILYWLSL